MANCDLSCRGFPVLDVEGLDLPPPVLVLRSREFEPLSVDLFSETRLHPFVLIFSSGSSTTESLCSGCLSCPSVKSGRCVWVCGHHSTTLQHRLASDWDVVFSFCVCVWCVCVCRCWCAAVPTWFSSWETSSPLWLLFTRNTGTTRESQKASRWSAITHQAGLY